jgi:L-cysteate sulfo-lyase
MSIQTGRARTLLAGLPKVQLGFFPTPLHRLDRLSEQLGVELYIKRDDFTGISLFGGNKIRKLEYLIGDAEASMCSHLGPPSPTMPCRPYAPAAGAA